MTENKFSTRFDELRKGKKISLNSIAKALDISISAVQKYYRGQNLPSYTSLIALADLFDVSLDYLTGRTDNANESYKPKGI
jgi:transcriptional regulator with XRE-family HTH domain